MFKRLQVQQHLSTSLSEGRLWELGLLGNVGGPVLLSLPVPGLDFIFLLHCNSPIITVQISDCLAIRVEGNSSSLLKSWKNVSYQE